MIVTSYVFKNGVISWENLEKMKAAVGKERLVLDLSCRKKENAYYIVTDRWQKFTDVKLTEAILEKLGRSCDEFLVHGVDVEGKASGVEEDLVRLLGGFSGIPVTYAGGIGSMADLERFRKISGGKLISYIEEGHGDDVKAALEVIRQSPISGAGLGTAAVQTYIDDFNLYHAEAPFVHAHNLYLQMIKDYAALLDTLAARLGDDRAVHFHAHFPALPTPRVGKNAT